MSAFKILAHRGASAHQPDNTVAAFELAIQVGSDMIETDVQHTADHVLVLVHDLVVQSHTVRETSYAELKAINPDILTVGQALAILGDKIPFCWEVKTPGIESALINLVHDSVPARIWERTEFTSFEFDSAVACHQVSPSSTVGWLTHEWSEDAIERVTAANLQQICPPAQKVLAQPNLVSVAHDKGLTIRCWEVTMPELAQDLAHVGVNGCTTNWPAESRFSLDTQQDVTLYQDELIKIFLPHDAHIDRSDGGHIIVAPHLNYEGIESCSRDLRHRLIDGAAAASTALLKLPQMDGGIVNIQDNGNWLSREDDKFGKKKLHIHVYGRSPHANNQPFGEALSFPLYKDRQTLQFQQFTSEEQATLHSAVASQMQTYLT